MQLVSRLAAMPVRFIYRFWHDIVGLAALAFGIITIVFAVLAEPAGTGGQIFRFGILGFGLALVALFAGAVEVERRLWRDRFPGWFICTGDARQAVIQRYGLQWGFGLSGVMFGALSFSCATTPSLYSSATRLVFAVIGQVLVVTCVAAVALTEREVRSRRCIVVGAAH